MPEPATSVVGERGDPPAARPGTVLIVVSAAAFLASLDLFVVAIAFPAIRADFPGSDLAAMSWVLNGYTVVFAAFLALAGRLGDRYGHRRVFRAGLVVFTLASAVCAVAPSVGALVAARAVQALGAALLTPASLALLLAAYPAERRARAVGVWASIGAVAAALGPPVGGLLVELSWHWVFLINLPVGVAALVAAGRVLPAGGRAGTGRPDVAGAVALVAAVGALAWALVRAAEDGWTDPWVVAGFAVTVLGLAAVVTRSRQHPVPALDLAVLRSPTLRLASVAMLLFTTGFSAMLLVNVLFLTGTWGWSAQRPGCRWRRGRSSWSSSPGSRAAGRPASAPVRSPRPEVCRSRWTAVVAGRARTGAGLRGRDAARPAAHRPGRRADPAVAVVRGRYGAARPALGRGSSLVNTARQIGAVLGTALSVTVVGATATGRGELTLLRHGWIMLVVCGAAAAVTGAALWTVEAAARRTVPTGGTP